MILNENYYLQLWKKFENVRTLSAFKDNVSCLTTKLILDHYAKNQSIHINFQNSKEIIYEVGKHLFVEFANDIYLNHYDLPENFNLGDKLKRIKDNQYFEIVKIENNIFALRQIPRKTKTDISPATIPGISYDRLTKNYVKIDAGKGISEKTIKNYFAFFEKLNNEKNEFPKTNFERRIVFIAKKPLWDSLADKSRIPSIYLPNPREENHLSETKSIPALSSCIVYFTPKYEVCYQNILLKGEKIKTIIVFDTEFDKIQQMLQDKVRFGFNIVIISNSFTPVKNDRIPCWNWYKEELEIVNKL